MQTGPQVKGGLRRRGWWQAVREPVPRTQGTALAVGRGARPSQHSSGCRPVGGRRGAGTLRGPPAHLVPSRPSPHPPGCASALPPPALPPLVSALQAGPAVTTAGGAELSWSRPCPADRVPRAPRGAGSQMKWSREPRCSSRVRPACGGTFWVASRVPSTVSTFQTERGTSLETLWRERASSCNDGGTT